MCGKDFVSTLYHILEKGSPPHVRERLLLTVCKVVIDRITPACAGKTFRAFARFART